MSSFDIISPSTLKTYKTVTYQSKEAALDAIQKAKNSTWPTLSLSRRIDLVTKFVQHFLSQKEAVVDELTHLIGR